jgi:hypothetical protein
MVANHGQLLGMVSVSYLIVLCTACALFICAEGVTFGHAIMADS